MAEHDAWAEARAAAAPNAIVIRIVYPEREDRFIEIPRTEENVAAALDLYDGGTITSLSPAPIPFEALGVPLPTKNHAGPPT